ncbi:MAG: alkaline phosphatase family protein [Verrucomicrobiales bacterium]|nr:alkaline phosphatase family protein [Verrucomicrobiales bacterium]
MKVHIFLITFLLSFVVPAKAAPPRLIVAILIDQLRYDYLERFDHLFVTNGFRLFSDHGAVMTFAHYNYVPTVTGPGHASFLSGSTPMMHGIIANSWFDRKSGKEIGCVDDPSVEGVGGTPGSGRASPKNFIGDSFADELRLRFGSKVVGLSIKDRAAILPAGRKPTGAYWFHSKTGKFITSSYYMDRLPDWVEAFNKRERPAEFLGQTWERLLDASQYPNPDDAAWEEKFSDEKKPVFNHQFSASKDNFDQLAASPFSNQLVAEFAEAAVIGEGLGETARPDLLCISFSAVDSAGHRFGPYSQEVQDVVLRLDRQLASFFEFLDRRVGLSNVLMTLTADHAVAPSPELAKAEGIDGQRLDEGAFTSELKEVLAEEFGPGRYFASAKPASGQIILNEATLRKKGLKPADVFAVIRDHALASGKFQACYSREQLLEGRVPGPLGTLVFNGFNAERSGDIVLIPKPFILPGTGKTGTTHGSPYSYDTHVPIMFYGTGIVPGRFADDFAITDIVPNLCALLRMNEPAGCMGKPLPRLLAP